MSDKADKKANDPAAEERARRHAELDAELDRADALAANPQKVIDANEAAALETVTGHRPRRDLSDAPPPGQLGPHEESVNPVADPADVNTSVAGNEREALGDPKGSSAKK